MWRVPMSATPALIVRTPDGTTPRAVWLRNDSKEPVYLGDASVTSSNGFKLGGNEVFGPITVTGELWGVCETGSSTIHAIRERR